MSDRMRELEDRWTQKLAQQEYAEHPLSTPTAVTVSDRMRELFDKAMHAYGLKVQGYIEHSDWEPVKTQFLFEIGWLETVIDQRGKRIQALAAMLDDILDAAWSYDDKPHQLLSAIRRAAVHEPDEEVRARIIENMDTAYTGSPQTRGEAMPALYQTEIENSRRSIAEFIPNASIAFRERVIVWLADSRSRLLTALEEARQAVRERNVELTMQDTNIKVLREALEEKEKECGFLDKDRDEVYLKNIALEDEIASLQSAAVLQKEELDRLYREGCHPRPSIEGGTASYSPTSGA